VAVLLNLSPDHLNRYAGMEDYIGAKARIFMNQGGEDFAVVNFDDPRCVAVTRDLAARVVPVSLCRKVTGGVYTDGDRMVSSLPSFRGEILPVDAVRIPGLHNLENALAATAAALVTGCDVAAIRSVLQEFPGLPHRMESAGEVRGVRFINDSKGTNIGAVLRSLESLEQPVHLIAGGQGKGTDYRALRKTVAERVDSLVLIGEAADRMAEDLSGTAASMEEAVRIAFAAARPGDVVLLSPGCASFDMFTDFEERGAVFCAEVRRLKDGR
jgi:UDP-N-acetylmuramoylalanine--D-glutamate ligase